MGEWIEIGDRYEKACRQIGLTRMGEWIEIGKTADASCQCADVSPVWVSGLKFNETHGEGTLVRVSPVWVSGLKYGQQLNQLTMLQSHPYG